MLPEVGQDFAGYRIESVLGRGGMGVVFRAYHHATSRYVALKVLAAELAQDPGFRARFQRESRLAATLEDPHVIPIHTFGEHEGLLYLDMRLVDGEDLDSTLQREGRLEPVRAASIIKQVADALDAAHARGLVHRDVKPGNVLLARSAVTGGQEFAYLADFGLTKPTDARSEVTATGAVLGTFEYMAPEQIEGRVVDGRADVYALGCLLFRCLTGEPPYTGNAFAMMTGHTSQPPPRLVDRGRQLGEPVDQVIARALAKDPNQRYQHAGDLARDAERALAGRSVSVPVVPPPPLSAPPPFQPTAYAGGAPAGYTSQPPGGYGGQPPSAPGYGGYNQPYGQPAQKKSRTPVYAAIAVLLVAILAGGIAYAVSGRNGSGGTIADPTVSPRPTSAATMTTEPSSSSGQAPTTTSKAPTTSKSPTTAPPSSDPLLPEGPGKYSKISEQSFLKACIDGSEGQVAYCSCVLDNIETTYTEAEFLDLATKLEGSDPPPELQDLAVKCIASIQPS